MASAELEAEKQECAKLQEALGKLRGDKALLDMKYDRALSELENYKSLVRSNLWLQMASRS